MANAPALPPAVSNPPTQKNTPQQSAPTSRQNLSAVPQRVTASTKGNSMPNTPQVPVHQNIPNKQVSTPPTRKKPVQEAATVDANEDNYEYFGLSSF